LKRTGKERNLRSAIVWGQDSGPWTQGKKRDGKPTLKKPADGVYGKTLGKGGIIFGSLKGGGTG